MRYAGHGGAPERLRVGWRGWSHVLERGSTPPSELLPPSPRTGGAEQAPGPAGADAGEPDQQDDEITSRSGLAPVTNPPPLPKPPTGTATWVPRGAPAIAAAYPAERQHGGGHQGGAPVLGRGAPGQSVAAATGAGSGSGCAGSVGRRSDRRPCRCRRD